MTETSEQETRYKSPLHQRRAGVILHPTSLPGKCAQGDLGPDACRFADFLNDCGISVWQMLPVGPTHEDRSPYMSLSVDAGNPGLISLELLHQWGWLGEKQLNGSAGPAKKKRCIIEAYQGFLRQNDPEQLQALQQFVAENADWLENYALFTVLRHHFQRLTWNQWPEPYRHREAATIAKAKQQFRSGIDEVCFEQFVFYRQWALLKQYANERQIQMVGDMPIFVAHDSAEVWQHQEYFDLHPDGSPNTVAGVPPDYFSRTGQRWGNPLYRWDRMADDHFKWWIDRFRVALTLYDAVRVDHFRGFEAFWEIDAKEDTAMNGRWVKAPGDALFSILQQSLGELPIIVEDLGTITPDVHALREKFGWPGMKILQFAFDGSEDNPYLPHNHVRKCVVYTGTHDNDTTLSWYEELPDHIRENIIEYLNHPGEPMPWALVECAFRSVADWAIVPMQDLLALGKGHRMNTPGVTENNWRWRFQWDQLPAHLADKVRGMVIQFERDVQS
ncbi:MAG: 4-alpha-glucanotransferase [Gammaproteobacteria bacterium]|nr:4-alpha-glucanotransferase [Gammaproteobacteria bacterium]